MRDIRISIAVIVTLLISLGIIMIYSASGIYALQELGDKTYYLGRHILFLCIALLAALGTMAIDYRILKQAAKPLLIVAIVLLVLVLVPGIGRASFGARRWFKIGFFNFQPSEFAKLVILVYLADFLSRKQNKIRNFWEGFFPLIMVLCVLCALIVKQPDLGNSFLIAIMILIMMFVAGARILHLSCLALSGVPLLVFLVVSESYRLRRIIAFIDPWKDAQGVGFQLSQSQIALGSGGIFGVGLGQSVQKLFYLPAAHTDFILSIVGEELGLLGTLAVVILFSALIWQGARIVKRTTEPFGYFLAFGIVMLIGLQAVINIGVSIGAFPTKGLPLPFVSYGGSALIFNMIAVALLMNISRIEDL
ncbi:MAG TPA: putative lipid II flippase FtsW [Candidatus Omnitrophota bacterium]|nr:putative lipid II flippase FtsW [Candidatus Omnitrophota bacterium]